MRKIKNCIFIAIIAILVSLFYVPSTYAVEPTQTRLMGMYKVRAKTSGFPMKYIDPSSGQIISESVAMSHRSQIKNYIDLSKSNPSKYVLGALVYWNENCYSYITGGYCYNGDAILYQTEGAYAAEIGSGSITMEDIFKVAQPQTPLLLVDYDDSYSAENFFYLRGIQSENLNVKQNGAYQVMDSNGNKFWISYEDIFIESTVVLFETPTIPMTDLVLSRSSISTTVGQIESLDISVLPIDANDIGNCVISTSNSSVMVINGQPQSIGNNTIRASLRAAGPGNATITVQCNGFTKTCSVTVIQPVTGININPKTLNLDVGKTSTLMANITPSNATQKNVTWISDNTNVATVNSNGVVTAIGKGTARITATTQDGNFADTCVVTVTQPVTGVSLNKTNLTLKVGESETLIATVSPTTANNTNVKWTTNNSSVATVTNGRVIAVGKGTATITVTTEDGNKTAQCQVTITQPVTGVSLNKTNLTLKVGESETLIATVSPTTANNTNVKWTTNNPSVATVTNGRVVAVGKGTAIITVTTEDGNKTAQCQVTITQPVTGVSLNKTNLTLKAGESETLIATVSPTTANNTNVKWTTNNPSVATVTNGRIVAVGKGTAIITVTTEDGNKTAQCQVTITQPVTGVSLNKTNLTLKVGESETLIATVSPTTADNTNVKWTTNNPSVATVTNGRIVAVGKGTAIITVTTEDGNKTAQCQVTVEEKPQIPATINVTGVRLDKTSATLKVGETLTLMHTIEPSNATNIKVTWSSNNENIATVNGGIVTAKAKGTVIITVTTEDGNKTAQCQITVEEKPQVPTTINVTGVRLDKTSAILKVGETLTLMHTIEPSNATNTKVTWSSNNENIATVNGGIVTAKAKGTVIITVTTEDGNKTAQCQITVEDKQNNSDEKENIVSNDYNVNEQTKRIKRISLDTKKEAFDKRIEANVNYRIYNKEGKEINLTDRIGTGMKMKTENSEYELIVSADLNGDGQLTVTDLTKMKIHIVSLQTLEGAFKEAADLNGDGEVSITDLVKIKRQLVGLE